jgi:hypothetical protein
MPGRYGIRSRSADANRGTVAERIDAAWAHGAVTAAQSEGSESTLGLLGIVAIPNRLDIVLICVFEHFLRCFIRKFQFFWWHSVPPFLE